MGAYSALHVGEHLDYCDCDDEECVGLASYCEDRRSVDEDLGRLLGRRLA